MEITPSLRIEYLGPSSKCFLPSGFFASCIWLVFLYWFWSSAVVWLVLLSLVVCAFFLEKKKSANSARYSGEATLTLGKQNREKKKSEKLNLEKLSFHVEKRVLDKWRVTFIKYRKPKKIDIFFPWDSEVIINKHFFSNIKITYPDSIKRFCSNVNWWYGFSIKL